MLKKSLLTLFVLVLVLAFAACSKMSHTNHQGFTAPSNKIKVLSTTSIIDDLVATIGGDCIDHTALVTGQLDPHSYELVKGDDDKIACANVLFYNGLGLEHGASLKYSLENKKDAYALADFIEDKDAFIFVDGQVDPHMWMDLRLLSGVVLPIAKTLSKYDPEHEELYLSNAQALAKSMLELDALMETTLQKIPHKDRYLITSHDAFYYFTRRYLASEDELKSGEWRLRCRAPEGLAPDGQMSPKDIGAIVEFALQNDVKVVFTESNVNQDALRKVVKVLKQKGLNASLSSKPLYGDTMGEPGSNAETYLKMMQYNMKMISDQLNASLGDAK